MILLIANKVIFSHQKGERTLYRSRLKFKNLMTLRRIYFQRTMYIIFWCTNFYKYCLKLIHDTMIFELFRNRAILNFSHCFTVFHLCLFFHCNHVLRTWTNCYRSFFWPLAKSSAKHLNNVKDEVHSID